MKTPAKRGRPALDPDSAKRTAALGLRVTPEMKDVLDERARRHGRTQSQEAVHLMEWGLRTEGVSAIYVQPIADAAMRIEALGVPLHSDAGQRLFIDLVEQILERLPVVAPTDEQHDYLVAKHGSGSRHDIAAAKARVDAYEEDLERKRDILRELMKLPTAAQVEREAAKQKATAEFFRQHGSNFSTESPAFINFVREQGGSVTYQGMTFTANRRRDR